MAEYHKLHLRDDNGRHGPYVEVNPADQSDPFTLLLEDPEPLTPEDRRVVWESLGELESDGQMERYEFTVRALEARLVEAENLLRRIHRYASTDYGFHEPGENSRLTAEVAALVAKLEGGNG